MKITCTEKEKKLILDLSHEHEYNLHTDITTCDTCKKNSNYCSWKCAHKYLDQTYKTKKLRDESLRYYESIIDNIEWEIIDE